MRIGEKISDTLKIWTCVLIVACHPKSFAVYVANAALYGVRHRTAVLTPSGYLKVESLKPGDYLFSWDIEKNKLVINQITMVHDIGIATAEFENPAPTGAHLEMSRNYPVYSPKNETFLPISSIRRSNPLFSITPDGCAGLLNTGRGDLLKRNLHIARTFVLAHEPANFIAEGILVQSHPR